MAVDRSLEDRFRQAQEANQRPAERPDPPLETGGGSGDGTGMDARVARIEEDLKELRADMKAVRADIGGVRLEISKVEGRLLGVEGKLSAMPTTWVMLTAIVGSMIALLGFTFIVLRYAGP